MDSTCYLISDLHLTSDRPDTFKAFAKFVSGEAAKLKLYILGDLFEAWLGDDDDSSLANEVRITLKTFTDKGGQLYIMPGNRDFLLGEVFCDTVGATLLTDPTVHIIGSKPTLLMHGDTLCTDDMEYQKFRKISRDPSWKTNVLSKSLEERRDLAKNLRQMSSEANSNKAESIMDVNASTVDEFMGLYDITQLIHGHTHRPQHHQETFGDRWVLGAWEKEAWILKITGNERLLKAIRI